MFLSVLTLALCLIGIAVVNLVVIIDGGIRDLIDIMLFRDPLLGVQYYVVHALGILWIIISIIKIANG